MIRGKAEHQTHHMRMVRHQNQIHQNQIHQNQIHQIQKPDTENVFSPTSITDVKGRSSPKMTAYMEKAETHWHEAVSAEEYAETVLKDVCQQLDTRNQCTLYIKLKDRNKRRLLI